MGTLRVFVSVLLASFGLASPTAARQVGITPVPVPDAHVLVPGSGWTGPTAATSYPGPFAEATSIAHWTRMPNPILWRESNDDFVLGVLAYHRSEIARVRFAVDDGPWVGVREMWVSQQTRHYEYGVTLVRENFDPGWHEVRAVAVPRHTRDRGGIERVLTWRFYNGAGEIAGVDYEERWVDPLSGSDGNDGSQAMPFASVKKAINDIGASALGGDGAVVYLDGPPTTLIDVGGATDSVLNSVPLTIRPAAGSAPRFAPQSGAQDDYLNVQQLRCEDLDIDLSWEQMFRRDPPLPLGSFYFANCHMQGYTQPASDHTLNAGIAVGQDGIYVADSEIVDIHGFSAATWMRGSRLERCVGGVAVPAIIDTTIRGNRTFDYGPVLSIWSLENSLADGVRLIEGSSFTSPLGIVAVEGTALVNTLIDGTDYSNTTFFEFSDVFQGSTHRHCLIVHCSFPGTYFDFSPAAGGVVVDLTNGLVSATAARWMYGSGGGGLYNNVPPAPAGMTLDPDTIHTNKARPAWSNWSRNSMAGTYIDFGGHDFRVLATSEASGRIPIERQLHRYDIDARPRGVFTDVGAFRGPNE